MSDADIALIPEFAPATREAWLALVDKVLRGSGLEQRLVAHTAEGLRVEPLYARKDAGAGTLVGRAAYFPGGWDIRQRCAEPDAKAANSALLDDLAGGVTSLALQILAPGQSGLSYAAEALGSALEGVFLEGCAVALDAGENTMDAAGSLIEIWRQRGIGENRRRGAFNHDPLGVLARTGTLYYPHARACEIAAKFASDCRTMTNVTALLADGRPYHEGGAGEAQELAAMLATLVAYLRACENAGVRPRTAFAKVGVGLAADADLFLTIAKLRAARKLIARIAEACGASHAADRVNVWATTSERMMAKRDPWVNMLRSAIACAGAALGGADAVTVLPYTWALGRPDAFARRIARNTQLVLQAESSLGRVSDAAHGAFFIETMTEELARQSWEAFQAIEAKGGMGAALESGYIQAEVARTAARRADNIAMRRQELTAISAFPRLGEDGVQVVAHPAAPPIVKGGTSVTPLLARRLAEPFEALRDVSDAHLAATGSRPQIFLACLGDLAVYSARATWTRNFLAAGGIEAIAGEALHTAADVANAFSASGARLACLCSSDTVYGELAEAAIGALKAAGARQVLLAGRPSRLEAALKAAGLDGFIFAGGNMLASLGSIYQALGIGHPLQL
ncbi:MAG TPA: methylmalonyl-CoA mutase family protein [Hyphomicrobiaceae bacterium]|jgi:methylmalonyl-CoA mutase